MNYKEPTGEQCNKNVVVFEDEHTIGYAVWYPQMGGYVGRAIALISKGAEGCFDVLVWHDGEFPFDGENGKVPCRLHHCSADQFISFGEKISELIDRHES